MSRRSEGAILLLALLAPAPVFADEGAAISLSLVGCDGGGLGAREIARLLRIELPDRRVVVEEGAPLRVTCAGSERALLERPGTAPVAIDLLDVAPALRPRTLVLAMAEVLRRPPLPATPPAPPAPPSSPPPPSPSPRIAAPAPRPSPPAPTPPAGPRQDARRLRLSGGLALGLGAATLAAVVVGPILVAQGSQTGEAGYQGAAAAVLSVGALAFVGAVVSLGFWIAERRKPAVALLPSSSGGALLVAVGEF